MLKKTFVEKIAYYSFIINMISIFCLSYKEETLIYSNIIFSVNVILMLTAIILRNKAIKFNGLHLWLACMLGWCFASTLWSVNSESVLIQCWTLTQIFAYTVVLYEFFRYRTNAIKEILQAYFVGGVMMALYALVFYGVNGIIESLFTNYRIGIEINQINTFGRNCAFAGIIGLYLNKLLNNKVYMFCAILPGIMVLASGSITALVIVVLGIAFLYRDYLKQHFIATIIFLGITIFASVILVNLGVEINAIQRLEDTLNIFTGTGQENSSSLLRFYYMQLGWHYFLEKPILGYGLSNFSELLLDTLGYATYSHNNYIEILVGLGIIGFSLYYSIYIKFIIKLYNLQKYKFIYYLLLIRLIAEIGSVSYSSKENYVFLVLFYIIFKTQKQKMINSSNSKLMDLELLKETR